MNKLLRSTWLPIAFGLCLFVSLYAATPSFTSFDQAWFTTNNLRISFRSNNVPILTTSNIYATNIYATNIYISTNITITTNITINSNIVATYNDLIWTNDSSFGGFGRITVKPEVTYEYLYPSNTIFAGWVSYVPQFKLLSTGSNNIACNMYSSWLLIGADPDPTVAQLYLQSGAVFGQDLILFSYTNTPFNGKFTLPADSAVVGGIGNVKLANGQDWVGENGAVLRLFWADPDWWEVGRWYAGGTNQPTTVTMNPTDGYLPVRVGPDTFGDSPWYTNSTDVVTDGRVGFGPGLTNWLYRDNSGIDLIYTNNNASQVRLGVASDTGLVYLGALSGFGGGLYANGGLQFNDGTSDLTFAFHQLYPNVDNDIELGIDGRGWKSLAMSGPIYFVPGTTNKLYRDGTDLVYTNGGTSTKFTIAKGDGTVGSLQMTTGSHLMLLGGVGSDVFIGANNNGSGDFVFNAAGIVPTSDGTSDLGSSSFFWNDLFLTNKIYLGPGTTNKIYRSGEDLIYENAGASPEVRVTDGSQSVKMLLTSTYGGIDTTRSILFLGNSVDSVQLSGTNFTGSGIDLGTTGLPWQSATTKSPVIIYGSGSGNTDYTRLQISHSGVAGTIDYTSQASGTGGSPVAHQFVIQTTNVMKLDASAAARETRLWIYDEDNATLERVTVGDPDSGGLGYKVLRIPN